MKKVMYVLGLSIVLALIVAACQNGQNIVEPQPQAPGSFVKANGDKVTICHVTGNGNYIVIEVNVNALDAHLAHGDYLLDADGDGFTAFGACAGSMDDCDDNDDTVFPGAEEICGDGIDNNCDGRVDEECGPTVTPGYSNLTEAAGVRYRGNSSGNEIYLGIPNLGTAGNRVEASYPNVYANWTAGTYTVTFSFDPVENKVATTINGAGGTAALEYDFDIKMAPGCATSGWNTLDINVVDRLSGVNNLRFNNVMLDGYSLGNFGEEGWRNWTVSDYDFSQGFTLTGDLVVEGVWSGSETNKLQLMVGCLP